MSMIPKIVANANEDMRIPYSNNKKYYLHMKKIIALVIFCAFIAACEKDDICDGTTPTTSQVVIKFYSAGNIIKRVTNLKITSGTDTLGVILNKSGISNARYLSNDTIVIIPLRTDQDITKFNFILNATNPITKKTDELQFNYSRTDEFVSRACGFKTVFDLNGKAPLQPIVLNNSASPSGNWIQNFQILRPIINDEKTTHIKIIF